MAQDGQRRINRGSPRRKRRACILAFSPRRKRRGCILAFSPRRKRRAYSLPLYVFTLANSTIASSAKTTFIDHAAATLGITSLAAIAFMIWVPVR